MLCPFCNEEILDESVKCKYCKEIIDIDKYNQLKNVEPNLINKNNPQKVKAEFFKGLTDLLKKNSSVRNQENN
ncbi:MAG TPA: hypothetical protein PKY81_15685 [bacterium]|nr:hypothetical protein [bacterium]HPN32393.1 hypothetical protein [bacterium]